MRAIRWFLVPGAALAAAVLIWAGFLIVEVTIGWSPGTEWVFSYMEFGVIAGAGAGVWLVLRSSRHRRSSTSVGARART